MTNEERDIITKFIARVGGAAPSSGFRRGFRPGDPAAGAAADRPGSRRLYRAGVQPVPGSTLPHHTTGVSCRNRPWSRRKTVSNGWSGNCSRPSQAAQQAQQSGQRSGGGGGFFSGLFGGGNRQQSAPRKAIRAGAAGSAGISGRPAAIRTAIGAAAAAIPAQLSTGHVPAARRLGLPWVGPDNRGRRCRRHGGRQRAHEPVFTAPKRLRRRGRCVWWRGGRPAPGRHLARTAPIPEAGAKVLQAATRIMSITAPGTSRPAPIRPGPTTTAAAATAAGIAAAAAVRTTRSRKLIEIPLASAGGSFTCC